MSDTVSTRENVFQFPWWLAAGRNTRDQKRIDALTDELRASLAREAMLAQEFEHRLANSLQSIVGLLSLQIRTATPEAAAQLTVAVGRVTALGRVHRRLHLLDDQEKVEFKQYLQHLCADLAALLCEAGTSCPIVVEGEDCEIPTAFGTPLGFIVNELITNSAKYAKGTITVRVEETWPACHSLSVVDNGPGLPPGFDPAKSKGLGMRIVLSLVKQIGGELHILPGDNGCGACFRVTF
jgi:two-component system, sensor histidine kinase PdtaS